MKKKKQQSQKRSQQSQQVPTLFDAVVDAKVKSYANYCVSMERPMPDAAETTARMRNIINSILTQMDNKDRGQLGFKQIMNSRLDTMPEDVSRPIIAALIPNGGNWKMGTGIMAFSMCVCAETIVKLAYDSGRLKDLFKMIDTCRRALYPYDLRNNDWTEYLDPVIAEIDLVSKQDFSALVQLLVLAGSDWVYKSIYQENEAKEARKYRKDLFRLLSEIIPSKEAKRGVRLFYGGLARQFVITITAVNRLVEEKQQEEDKLSLSKLFKREDPDIETARFVADVLPELANKIIEDGSNMRNEKLRFSVGPGGSEPELLLLGTWLAMAEEPILDSFYIAFNVLIAALFLTNYGYKAASVCSGGPLFVALTEKNTAAVDADNAKEAIAITKEVTDLFLFQDKPIISENDIVIKNGQALVATGLSILSSTKDKERIKDLGNQAAMYIQSIKPTSPAICGALTATYLLCAGKLIKSPEMFYDDRAQFVQAAADAEAAKSKAVDQQKAAESALAQAKTETEELRARVAELERLLTGRENELETVYAEKAALQEQTDELLDLLSQEEPEQVEEDTGIQLPYDVGDKKILVFGGFPAFINNLQEYIHGAVYIDPSRRDAMQIRSADGVMIQLNRIGHPDFYSIVSICKAHNIPIGYFKTAGAQVCAMQMAKFIDGLPTQN